MYLSRSRSVSPRPVRSDSAVLRFIGTLGVLTLGAAVIQVSLGAPLAIIALALFAVAAGLFGMWLLGSDNIASWVAFFYALGNVIVALLAKTVMGQSLDSNLEVPYYSFLAVAVTAWSLSIALVLVKVVPVGRALLAPITDPSTLALLSWACLALGIVFWFINRQLQDPSGTGFGGIALFRDLLVMAVIARTAMLLEQTASRQSFDTTLGVILVVGVTIAVIDNTKTQAVLPVLGYMVTVLCYRRRLPLLFFLATAGAAAVFIFVLAPFVHTLRASGQRELDIHERIALVSATTKALYSEPRRLADLRPTAVGQFRNGYYDYFGDDGDSQMLLGRYVSVQQIDPVIAKVNWQEPRGSAAILPGVARLIPSIWYPNKPDETEAFATVTHYGLVDPAGGKYPTLPLAGQAYAAYGGVGLILVPLATFSGFFLILKKLGWTLHRNVCAIFFLTDFVIVYVSQGEFGQYAAAGLRNFPLYAATFSAIKCVGRLCLSRDSKDVPAVRRPISRVLTL